MKKAYVKPEIELESFQFSANVAGGCVNIVTKEWVQEQIDWGALNTDEQSCLDIPCYHNPDGNPIFTS